MTRDITVEVTRNVTEQVEEGFRLQSFDAKGELSGSSIALTKGAQATYDAEFLFNLDLNSDKVQGRNTSLNETKYHSDNKLTAFKQNSNTDLHRDIHSDELLTTVSGQRTPKTILSNSDGSSYTPADNHTVVAAEADANGNINLLSWNQATNSFNLQLFGANGSLTGSPLP